MKTRVSQQETTKKIIIPAEKTLTVSYQASQLLQRNSRQSRDETPEQYKKIRWQGGQSKGLAQANVARFQ